MPGCEGAEGISAQAISKIANIAACHLRTVTTTNPNKAQPQYNVSLDLPVGQTIVPADSQLRDETLSKINKSLDEGPGRMFAVVHVRGFQHKITDGKSFNPCLSSA